MSATALARAALQSLVQARDDLAAVSVFDALPSTNSWLLGQPAPALGSAHVAMTLDQTAGRGQRGRRWVAPPESGLCLSLAYRFSVMPPDVSAMTLATGVAVSDALSGLGVDGVYLKWPNDLVCDGAKLGGILVESSTLPDQSFLAVVGIGINHNLPNDFELPSDARGWANAVTDVTRQGGAFDLSVLAAAVANSVLNELVAFATDGFAGLAKRYNAMNWLSGQSVQIDGRTWTCGPVDSSGRLQINAEDSGETSWLTSGEPVPMRLARSA